MFIFTQLSPAIFSHCALNNDLQHAHMSKRPSLRRSTPGRDISDRVGNHGDLARPLRHHNRNPWTLLSMFERDQSTSLHDIHVSRLPLTLEGNSRCFPSQLKDSTVGPEEPNQGINTPPGPIPSLAAPEPLPPSGDPFKRPERASLPRPKVVSFSKSLVEFIPGRSPSPSTESEETLPQTRSSSGTTQELPRNPTSSMQHQKPVPTRPPLAHPVPMRKGTPIPPPHLKFLPKYACSRTLSPTCTKVSSGDHKQPSLPPPAIQAAHFRVKKFVESHGYKQFVADQHLVGSFLGAKSTAPENERSSSSLQIPPIIPPGWNSSTLVELPFEEVSYEQECTTTTELTNSPDSIMKTEQLSVVRPKNSRPAPPGPGGLRRTPKLTNLRQKFSLRAGLRKALPNISSRRLKKRSTPVTTTDCRGNRQIGKNNQDPEDWYPPRKYRPREWKPATQIVNNQNVVTRKESIGKLIDYTRSLLKRR